MEEKTSSTETGPSRLGGKGGEGRGRERAIVTPKTDRKPIPEISGVAVCRNVALEVDAAGEAACATKGMPGATQTLQ
jgi:hypothetical protein